MFEIAGWMRFGDGATPTFLNVILVSRSTLCQYVCQ